jgi:hypothetical protein
MLRRTGVWQWLLAWAALAVVWFSADAYSQARADLRTYQMAATNSCSGGGDRCLDWAQVPVASVTIPADDKPTLEVIWSDYTRVTISFPDDMPLLHRVSKGSQLWVGSTPDGDITAVSDYADPPTNALLVAQSTGSPVYRPWPALAWLIAAGWAALLFGWQAVVVRIGRAASTGPVMVRIFGSSVATAMIVVAIVSLPLSTFGIDDLEGYGAVFAVAVLPQILFWSLKRQSRMGPRPSHVAAVQAPAAPPGGQPAASGSGSGSARGARRRWFMPHRATIAKTRTSLGKSAVRSLPPAGGLGPRRARRLLGSTHLPPRPVTGVAAPPELVTLVASVASAIRVPEPDQVLVGCRPVVELEIAGPGQPVKVSIGTPLALALPVRDLRALIAHAIAVLSEPQPWLATALLSARQSLAAMQQTDQTAAFLADTQAFWSDIEKRADQAALLAVGSPGRALAGLIRRAVVARDFEKFCDDFRPAIEDPTFPDTLYAGWVSTLHQRMPEWWFDTACHPDAIAADVAAHPGLATEWGTRPHAPVWRRPRRLGMIVALSTSDESQLAREYLAGVGNIEAARLIPVEWSGYDADRIHRDSFHSPTQAATTMLGHHASPGEILSMLEGETGRWLVAAVREEVRRSLHWHADRTLVDRITDPAAFTTGTVLAGLVAETMHLAGYRHTDPLRPQLMGDPAGHQVDVYAVVTDALVTAEGMERLRSLLLAGTAR